MSILTYRHDNPRRPVDWRWQRACEIVSGASTRNRRDDSGVRVAVKFKRVLDNCTTDRQQLALLDASPALFEAYDIYDVADNGGSATRWELEARLLTRMTFADITLQMGLAPDVIEAYEHYFFDVINRLDYPSIVVHTVIGSKMQAGLAERDFDCLWKMLGYSAGRYVLDAFIYKLNAPVQPATADEAPAFFMDQTKELIRMKGFTSALTMPVGYQTRGPILELWARLLEAEQSAGAGGVGSEILQENIRSMLDSMPWQRYQPDQDKSASTEISRLEATGVRLRSNELTLIGVGETPAELPQLISTAKFPE